MGDTNITSRGQSGGITAHTVEISSAPRLQPPNKKTSPWKKWILIISAAVAFIASLIAILEYFGISLKESRMSDDKKINVTSINQSGGITAHTVNVEPQPRQMTPELGKQLSQLVPLGSKVTVVAVMGDSEAFAFASAIKSWLQVNGYTNVSGVDQAVYSQPVTGQNITKKGDGFEIVIGGRP